MNHKTNDMEIQVVTIIMSNLDDAKLFYEDTLGFQRDAYYEPTRWLSFQCQG